ncbi:MAG TPA: DUF5719 family protein [Actinomycetota bacterium]|nr:DUF5719 family protein [Actinomycetota bacterium]
MIDRTRDASLAAGIVLLLLAGLVLGAGRDDIEPTPVVDRAPVFVEEAMFCPPVPGATEGAAGFAAGAPSGAPLKMDVITGDDEEPVEVPGETILLRDPDDAVATTVVGFGSHIEATGTMSFSEPVSGLGSAACLDRPATDWYFPQGSSARDFNERLVLLNPFQDEAVVNVTFFTRGGRQVKARLQSVPVPAGETTSIRVNQFILQQRTLAAHVSTERGRILAWKALFDASEERNPGVSVSQGLMEPNEEWFFPAGGVGGGLDERISLLNTTADDAVVNISLVTDEQMRQPSSLVEITVPSETVRDISLNEAVNGRDLGAASAIVRSVNGVPLFAERSVSYGDPGFRGYASEMGAGVESTTWWLGSVGPRLTNDSIVVLNLDEAPATVTVSLWREDGQPVDDVSLEEVRVRPGGRARISLEDLTGGEAMVALLEASGPVIAERVGASSERSDVTSLMGVPITGRRP